MRALDLTLLTDLYELTMMQGYFKNPTDQIVVFDAFYRKNPCDGAFAIAAGLEQVIEYIRDLHFTPDDIDYLKSLNIFDNDFLEYLRGFHFTGDIYAIPEGTVVFPREPLLKVIAPVMEAQLVETAILNIINHQSLIATKAARVVHAARGDGIMEFGLRRAQGPDAGIYGARAAVIAGCVGTSNVLTGKMFNVPVKGTHAHSWIMSFPDEYTAFKTYAEMYPNACILLVDTYDVLESGVPNAIRVFQEMKEKYPGFKGYGIRIDSGDITYLSKKARKMLDEAGFPDCKICASNSLDEYIIRDMLIQGAKVDSFGVGERLITASPEPVFGGVYKLAAVEDKDGNVIPKIKISENVSKITTPCFKKVWRLFDRETGKAIADVLTLHEEVIDDTKPYEIFDPEHVWKRKTVTNFRAVCIQEKIFEKGKCLVEEKSLKEIKEYCAAQVGTLWDEVTRFENPHQYYVDLSQKLWDVKDGLLKEHNTNQKI